MTQGGALAEGYLVNDRFQLLRLLGRGGMGSVWVARHLSLKIEVAIKFIDGPLGGREDLRSRFAQEARTAARIQNPHVVNILDYGFDGIRPFIVMELLQGEALNARLEREGRLAPGEVSIILSQAARGLGRAHTLGIVHRDLKPDNLFLSRDEDAGFHVKLLDFGIARDETPLAAVSHRTGTGQLLGTPAYMSPEQARGKPNIDFRSDLYSLAVVVYHCVTGRLPFESVAMGELLVAISVREPPPPSSLVLGVSPTVDAWFQRAFQKEPSARFGSAKELAEAFALACHASAPAYDRTLLAPGGSPAPPNPAQLRIPPTMQSPGVPAPLPAATAPWSRAGLSPARSSPSGPPPSFIRTAPLSPSSSTAPPPRFNPSPVPPSASQGPMVETGNAAAVRIPDTFNGQSATQGGDAPPGSSRGSAPLVFGLIGLVLLVALGGAGVYATRLRATPAGPSAATSGALSAPAETLAPTTPAPSASASPISTVAAAPAVAPSASAPSSTVAPAAPPVRPSHPSPTKSTPTKSASRPSPVPTNDYGL